MIEAVIPLVGTLIVIAVILAYGARRGRIEDKKATLRRRARREA